MDNQQMHECIRECWECRDHCQKILFNYCLKTGGKHLEEEHVKLMTDCIQICQVAADFMVRNSILHKEVCSACAKICEACAESCEKMNDQKMNECTEFCRKCAASCMEMAESNSV